MSAVFHSRVGIAFGLVVALAIGCAHYPVNAPLEEPASPLQYRYENLSHEGNSDEIFVVLTFSGGGGRAAALSYGVLEQLRDTEITINGERRRLLDEVDVISSVSGGSFTAAYYALHRDDIFENYEEDFLYPRYQTKVVLTALNPLQWFRYLSPHFSLSDRASEIYDKELFHGATYADLVERGRPYVVLNATDITLGQPFQLTQDQFDYIGSDIASMPLARAVTASSAVPVVLTPVTLRCYAPDNPPPVPQWVTQQIASPDYPSLAWQQANQLLYYLDREKCQYVHLVDGGIADNLGLRPGFRPHPYHPDDLSISRLVNEERAQRALVITVNAANRPETGWTARERPPGSIAILNRAIAGLMTSSSTAFSREMRQRVLGTQSTRNFDVDMIDIGFSDIPDTGIRRFYENIGTTLNLDRETTQRLITAGAHLLAQNPTYQEFVETFDGTIAPTHFDFDQAE